MVATLAMLLRTKYEVTHAALKHVPRARTEEGPGYSLWEATAAATALGYRVHLVPAGAYDPYHSDGLLSIWTETWGHVFLVRRGLAFDPGGSVWVLSDYLSVHGTGARLGELLVVDGWP